MFPVLFWQQLFSVPCFKVNFPLRLIRCIAISCVFTCYSPLLVLHVFIFSLTHCPLLHHPPCLSVSLHRIPWVFHHSYHFLPRLWVFFCKLSTLNLHFLVSLVLRLDPHSFCLDNQSISLLLPYHWIHRFHCSLSFLSFIMSLATWRKQLLRRRFMW